MQDLMRIRIDESRFASSALFSLFTNQTDFVDELVQNASRAGAKNIKLEIHDDGFEFADDGKGCHDMSVLTVLAGTGWSEDVVAAQNPFGLGFFAVGAVASQAEVQSHGGRITFDFDKLRKGQLEAVSLVSKDPFDGFRVNAKFGDNRPGRYDVKRAFENAVRFSGFSSATFCGTKVHTDSSIENVALPAFGKRFEHEGAKCAIAPLKYLYNAEGGLVSDVMAFAQRRPVQTLGMYYCAGIVDLDGSSCALRAPDRKGIIKDNAYASLTQAIRNKAKEIAVEILNFGNDEQLSEYENFIDFVMTADEIAENLRVNVITSNMIFSLMSAAEAAEQTIGLHRLAEASESEVKAAFDAAVSNMRVVSRSDAPDVEFPRRDATASDNDAPAQKPAERRGGQTASSLGSDSYYCTVEFLVKNRGIVEQAVALGARVVIAANKLTKRAMEAIGAVPLSSDSDSRVIAIKNRGASGVSQKRALAVFQSVCSAINNAVQVDVADVYTTNGSAVEAVFWHNNVIIDRKALASNLEAIDYRPSRSKGFSPADVQLLLLYAVTLGHELSHANGNSDGTQDHFVMTEQLTCMILRIAGRMVRTRKMED